MRRKKSRGQEQHRCQRGVAMLVVRICLCAMGGLPSAEPGAAPATPCPTTTSGSPLPVAQVSSPGLIPGTPTPTQHSDPHSLFARHIGPRPTQPLKHPVPRSLSSQQLCRISIRRSTCQASAARCVHPRTRSQTQNRKQMCRVATRARGTGIGR